MHILTAISHRTYTWKLSSAAGVPARLMLAILLLCGFLSATTVTGKAVDANGNPYTTSVAAALLSSGPPTSGGKPVNPSSGPFGLGLDGSFSLILTDTSTITPPGSVWVFTFCGFSVNLGPAVNIIPVCFTTAPVAVTGTSLDITTTISASVLNLGPNGSGNVKLNSLAVKTSNPWWDVCANGLACDGATDDTAAFNSLLTTACTGGGGTLWIPPAKTVRFASAPSHIPCGLTIAGAYSKGSAFGFGSFIKCDYTEATATNGCLWWDGANLATQGNGGGVRGVNIQKGDGKTGGAAIKVSGASCAARAGNVRIDGVKVSSSTGTWNYGMYVDGTACTTLGTAGSRDNEIVGMDTFSATTKAASFNTCVHCYIFGLETAIGAGSNADVEVTGTSTANAASNDVLIAASEMTNLTFDWATNITCAGCNVTGTFTSTANNTSSTFHGVAGGYSTASASVYTQNTTIVPGGSYANIVAAGVVPNLCTAVGYMCESTGPTAGTHFIGSDGLFFFRRNTGSAAGSNFTWSYDSGSTFPYAFDATNGFTSTLPIISPSLRLNGNTLNGITGTGTAVVTNGGPTITGTTTLSVATGTAPLAVTSTTPVANLTTVPAAYNAAGTQQTNTHIVSGSVTTSGAGTATVTLSGAAVFTSGATYNCTVSDNTNSAVVAKVVTYDSGSQFRVAGANTTGISYVCVGN